MARAMYNDTTYQEGGGTVVETKADGIYGPNRFTYPASKQRRASLSAFTMHVACKALRSLLLDRFTDIRKSLASLIFGIRIIQLVRSSPQLLKMWQQH